MKTATKPQMKYFRLRYADGSYEIASAVNMLALIRERDLCTKAHVNTHITQLSGEQEAIAIADAMDD